MINSTVFKGASVLSLSQIVVAISTFARNILVARLISVEDFGIATTFAITLAMIEMASNLAFEKILVQDESGGDDDMLASAHFLHFIKSIVTALILLLVSPVMAKLFDLQNLVWAFQVLALIPLLRGLSHFDTVVFQRNMRFAPTAIIDAIPQALTVVFAYPLGIWLEDYRVMLILVLLQPASYTLLSHLYAERPYRWLFDKKLLTKKLGFAWPLLINGLLMFAVFNGDKAIIGNSYSMAVLGWYSVAFALTMMPTILFAKICNTLLLPILSKSLREDTKLFGQSCIQAFGVCTGVASFTLIFFIIAGSAVIYLCYGERYMNGAQVVVLLAVMQSIRIIRIAPTIIAISYSHTKNAMYANIARVTVIPIAIYLAINHYDVKWIVVCGIVGEVLALLFASYLLKLGSNTRAYLKANILHVSLFVILAFVVNCVISFVGEVNLVLINQILFIVLGFVIASLGLAFHLICDQGIKTVILDRMKWFAK